LQGISRAVFRDVLYGVAHDSVEGPVAWRALWHGGGLKAGLKCDIERMRWVEELFRTYDVDQDGILSMQEYKRYLQGIGLWGELVFHSSILLALSFLTVAHLRSWRLALLLCPPIGFRCFADSFAGVGDGDGGGHYANDYNFKEFWPTECANLDCNPSEGVTWAAFECVSAAF